MRGQTADFEAAFGSAAGFAAGSGVVAARSGATRSAAVRPAKERTRRIPRPAARERACLQRARRWRHEMQQRMQSNESGRDEPPIDMQLNAPIELFLVSNTFFMGESGVGIRGFKHRNQTPEKSI